MWSPLPTQSRLEIWVSQDKTDPQTKIVFTIFWVPRSLKCNCRFSSKVSTRAGCGVAIYVGITRERYHIFYGLILLLRGLSYSLLTFLHWKGKNLELVLIAKRTEWRKFIEYFGRSLISTHIMWEKRTYIFLYWVYTKHLICKYLYIKGVRRCQANCWAWGAYIWSGSSGCKGRSHLCWWSWTWQAGLRWHY